MIIDERETVREVKLQSLFCILKNMLNFAFETQFK